MLHSNVPNAGAGIFIIPNRAAVSVVANGKVLLAQRGIEPFKGFWDIPAVSWRQGSTPKWGKVIVGRNGSGNSPERAFGCVYGLVRGGGLFTLNPGIYLAEIVKAPCAG